MTSRAIPDKESITVEFKSDCRQLSDDDLVAAAVCLANTQGGEIYLGVEDNGAITGLNPGRTNGGNLAGVIAARTVPSVSVRLSELTENGHAVIRLEVPRSTRLVATVKGLLQRRRLKADGTPECVPLLPHEFASRESDLGLLDYSALPVRGASTKDFDPLERARLRRLAKAQPGDGALLDLSDEDLDGALGLVAGMDGGRVPTVAGLLLLGTEAALRQHLPTHEVLFQVLEGTDVRVNEAMRGPLLRVFERVEEMFSARVVEQEVEVGLFRVSVPNVDRRAFREAFANALTHRDYAKLGAVQVQWRDDELEIGSPGGFVEGVNLENLLVVQPRPRNPLLADAFKRLGLAERTGRGVDRIFEGLLRSGRRRPDYGRSDSTRVVVRLPLGDADLAFVQMIAEAERSRGKLLPIDALVVLGAIRDDGRIDAARAAQATQRSEDDARVTLNALVESGFVEAHGQTRGRSYTLSPKVYRSMGKPAAYVRQAGFDSLQQEQMILTWVRKHGPIRRSQAAELCRIDARQAGRLLVKMTRAGALELHGARKTATYRLPTHEK